MKEFLKSYVRNSLFFMALFKKMRRFRGCFLLQVTKSVIRLLRPNLVLTYWNNQKLDGVGAQLQRLFAINGISSRLNIGYFHSEISDVAVHPLDSYQSSEEREKFIKRLNRIFFLYDTTHLESTRENRYRNSLGFSDLIQLSISSRLKNIQFVINVIEPYSISEFDAKTYEGISEKLVNFSDYKDENADVAIHYRWGVGGKAIQKGEKLSRELDYKYFKNLLKDLNFHKASGRVIDVFTDAPSESAVFELPKSQLSSWVNSPGVDEGRMAVLGVDDYTLLSQFGAQVNLIRGGDPIKAITAMASARILIMSRSSLSYVAALLNNSGTIYFPSSFWHRPQAHWKVIKDNVAE